MHRPVQDRESWQRCNTTPAAPRCDARKRRDMHPPPLFCFGGATEGMINKSGSGRARTLGTPSGHHRLESLADSLGGHQRGPAGRESSATKLTAKKGAPRAYCIPCALVRSSRRRRHPRQLSCMRRALMLRTCDGSSRSGIS